MAQATKQRGESASGGERRGSFEVAGWDGARWILEGVFESGVEAATEAKAVIQRRLGVKVTEEVFNADEGTFKSRIVFTEYRQDPPQKADPKKKPEPAPKKRVGQAGAAGSEGVALYISVASLSVSILALFFSLLR